MTESLKDRINQEMTVDYANSLEKNFNVAKELMKITKEGKVDVIFKGELTGIDNVSLYLIGKRYAKEAGFSTTEFVGNSELIQELGIPEGSVKPWIKKLRDDNMLESTRSGRTVEYCIKINLVERILREVKNKLDKSKEVQE